MKIVTTLAWQLKPKTMIGKANRASKFRLKSLMSPKGAGRSVVICHARTTIAVAVNTKPMTAATLTYRHSPFERPFYRLEQELVSTDKGGLCKGGRPLLCTLDHALEVHKLFAFL